MTQLNSLVFEMNLRHSTFVIRQLAADLSYATFVVLGLALALAAVTLLFAYAKVTLAGDADVSDADRVVRVETLINSPGSPKGWIVGSPLVFYDHWAGAGAPVSAATRYFVREMSVRAELQLRVYEIGFVDPGLVKVFALRSLTGDLEDSLARPDAAAIDEHTAITLFGTRDAVGKPLEVAGKTLTVRAVFPNRPAGSAIAAGILVSIKSSLKPDTLSLDSWSSMTGSNYVRLLPEATPQSLAERAQSYFEQTPFYKGLPPAFKGTVKFRATTLPDLALSGAGTEATRRIAIGLSISCLIIVVLAAINYLNISTLRTMARQREIGIRKALGAGPLRIAIQFLVESVLVAAIACVLGVLIAWLMSPIVGTWVGRPIADAIVSPETIVLAVAFSLVLGLIVGIYPSWIALRVSSCEALAGRGQSESSVGLWVRRGLTVVQFAAAVALVAVTIIILWQNRHVGRIDPGYDPESILIIDAPVDMRDSRLLALREALQRLNGVKAVGLSWDVPGRFKRSVVDDFVTVSGEGVAVGLNFVGPGFFQSYDISPLAGRVFDPETDKQGSGRPVQGQNELVVINESAARLLGFLSPEAAVGKLLGRSQGAAVEIIGVIRDIRQRSLRERAGGVVYSISSPRLVSVLSVKADDTASTARQIQVLWPVHFPDDVLRLEPVRVHLQRLYEADVRLGKLIGAGGFVALCLAGFGLYSLSAYVVRRRTPELVLRKLYGAGRREIAVLLIRDFGVLLVLGAFLALPVSVWLGEDYLSGFVERSSIVPWALVIAFACTGLVALVAAGRQVWRATIVSPLGALRV
jgi:putative ABC transport system permease protein